MMNFVLRLTLAFFLAGLIGLERQKRQRLAGMRTNVLVALAAFLFVSLSMGIENEGSPTRMAAQVVSGIGFLGAGVIMRDGFNVRGLNTAATLWCSAAIGVLTSAGFIFEAAIGTLYILFANVFLRRLIDHLHKKLVKVEDFETVYLFKIKCEDDCKYHIRTLLVHMLQSESFTLMGLTNDAVSNRLTEIIAKVSTIGNCQTTMEKITSRLGIEEGVQSIQWEIENFTENE